jgi:hypothetical protein
MIAASSGQNFRFVDLPWFPGEFRIMTPIDPGRLTARSLLNIKTTVLKDWKNLVHHSLVDEFGDYQFSHMSSGGETENFFWQRPLTAAEMLVPFLTEWESVVHPWPPYLEELKFVRDKTTGRAVEREAFHDGVSVSCDVKVEWFVKDGPFTKADMFTDEPIPGPVSWDFQTSKGPVAGRFPDCLHGLVEIKTRGDPNQEIIDAMPNNNIVFGNVRRFEATNHTKWRPHVFSNERNRDEAFYYRRQRTVFPPRGSRIIKL